MWRPSASMASLRARAHLLSQIRVFFNARGYLEVETPVLARHGVSDCYLSNIKALVLHQPYCLQTSPEYHMKRLLAAGSGAIYQLARVFRDDELGRWHNPEFGLLEWYQLDITHHELMTVVDDLLQLVLGSGPMQRITYQQVFMDHCGLDPFTASIQTFRETLCHFDLQGVLPADEEDVDQYLFLLMSHVIEQAFIKAPTPIAVYDFPPSQASLAEVNEGVAERFEVYYGGVELANGFHELTDAGCQRARFMRDNEKRAHMGLDRVLGDEYLLEALENGLPACSGVAMGLDRLIALAQNESSIQQVMAFDFSRA